MKKTLLINSEISRIIASLGHMDMITIADAGLPIPGSTERIDLALTKNIPSFIDTVKTVSSELKVQEIIIAEEMKKKSPHLFDFLKKQFKDCSLKSISHEEFKKLSGNTKAIIRTGEFTPYANVIFVSGVVF